jgi:tetratricopeptide (TPR) repeat protein
MIASLLRDSCARLVAGALALALLGGCASLVPQTMGLRDAWPAGVATRAELVDAPFFAQQEHQCGPAALATSLGHAGANVAPEKLAEMVYLPQRQGSLQTEMLAAPRRLDMVSYQLAPRFEDLLREVAAGNPVVVLQDIGIWPLTDWHYAVVVGFDYASGELYLRSGGTKRLAIPFTIFEYTWRKGKYWAMVTVPPRRIPATAARDAHLDAIAAMERVATPHAARAAYAAHLDRWPGSLAASIGLANQHYAMGELVAAERVLRAALDQHPDSAAVANNLAQTLSDLGRNVEAMELLGRIVLPTDSPLKAAVDDTRALVERRLSGKG